MILKLAKNFAKTNLRAFVVNFYVGDFMLVDLTYNLVPKYLCPLSYNNCGEHSLICEWNLYINILVFIVLSASSVLQLY